MAEPNKFGLLRKLLTALGLKEQAVDEIVDRIVELLSGGEKETVTTLPYALRDAFLTPAEHSFYMVLRQAVEGRAIVFTKVSLGDVFLAKSSDPSVYRTATNRIDRGCRSGWGPGAPDRTLAVPFSQGERLASCLRGSGSTTYVSRGSISASPCCHSVYGLPKTYTFGALDRISTTL